MRMVLAAALIWAGSMGVAASADLSPAQLDTKILKTCATQGSGPSECVCALKIAKEEMTPRQLALVPVLLPIAGGPGDSMSKLSRGMAASKAAGYTDQEAIEAVMAVVNNADRTKKECKKPS